MSTIKLSSPRAYQVKPLVNSQGKPIRCEPVPDSLPAVGAVYENADYRATVTGHTHIDSAEVWIRFDREELGDIGRYRYHRPEAMIARLPVFLAVYAATEEVN